jgi:hypothetical protein
MDFSIDIEDGVCPKALTLFSDTGHTNANALANLRFIAGFFPGTGKEGC